MIENDINELIALVRGIVISGVTVRCIYILSGARSDEGTLKQSLDKMSKVIKAGLIVITLPEVAKVIASLFAPGAMGSWSALQNKVNNLLENLFRILYTIEIGYSIFLFVKEAVLYQMADQNDKSNHKKNMRNNLIVSAVIISGTSIIRAIFNYFI